MSFLTRLQHSKAFRNSISSYVAYASTIVCGLLSIPIVVSHLQKEEIGIWVAATSITGFLTLFDLGVGDATGRKIADAVASGDQNEINRWWSATRFALMILATIMVAVGVGLTPAILSFLDVSEGLRRDATILFVCLIVISGLGMLIRGVPGLMVAQERAHLNSIGQACAVWIQMGTLFVTLRFGAGMLSCVIAFAVMQFFLWLYFAALIATGPNPPKWDRSGIKKDRMKSLIRFSFPFIFMLLVDSSLSAVMLIAYARFGSLALLPALSFTIKGPVLLGALANRTMWAFYPGFLRLQLTGQADLLREKQQHLATLTLSGALFLASAIIAFNRTLVELIAGQEFFAGTMTNTWLALSIIIGSGMQLFRNFLHLSGSMGKVPLVCVASLVIAIGFSWAGYQRYGLPGMVAPYLLPGIALGLYGLYHGVRMCGYNRVGLSQNTILLMCGYSLLLLAFGVFASAYSEPMGKLSIFEKAIHLPSYSEMAAFGLCTVISLIGVYRATRGFNHLATRVSA